MPHNVNVLAWRYFRLPIHNVMRLLYFSLLRNVIFSCFVENNLIIACGIKIKILSL